MDGKEYVNVYSENGNDLNSYYSCFKPNIGELYVDADCNEHVVKQIKHVVNLWGDLKYIVVIVSDNYRKIDLEFPCNLNNY